MTISLDNRKNIILLAILGVILILTIIFLNYGLEFRHFRYIGNYKIYYILFLLHHGAYHRKGRIGQTGHPAHKNWIRFYSSRRYISGHTQQICRSNSPQNIFSCRDLLLYRISLYSHTPSFQGINLRVQKKRENHYYLLYKNSNYCLFIINN